MRSGRNGSPGYRIGLAAGGALIASGDDRLSVRERQFETSTIAFTPPASRPGVGRPPEVRLIHLDLAGPSVAPGLEVDFDGVRRGAVPIPGSPGLLSGGLIATLVVRRRAHHPGPPAPLAHGWEAPRNHESRRLRA